MILVLYFITSVDSTLQLLFFLIYYFYTIKVYSILTYVRGCTAYCLQVKEQNKKYRPLNEN